MSILSLAKTDMSNDFLRSYTIPTLQKSETVVLEGAEQPALKETPGISNYSRYLPPGRQGDGGSNVYPSNSRKRPVNDAPNIENAETIPIFTGRDRSYPDELNLLINPLFCELCRVQLNSQKSATCHYESKLHDRKITAWLTDHYPNNPPVVKRFIKDGPTGPEAFRCDECDLPLTSLAHAKQHYAGRKHRLVAAKRSDPSGVGYYDSDGKWTRTGSKKFDTDNTGGRFGIGTNFLPEVAPKTTDSNEQKNVPSTVSPKSAALVDESLCCKVCDVIVTSSTQMAMHLSGAKHKKKSATSDVFVVPPENNDTNANSILATINDEVTSFEDLSMYRTPSGSYYCQICNTTMNHVTVLQQHIQGKKHKTKAKSTPVKSENSPA